jgi:tetratricopeptide (TPR) repeat protein
MRDKDYLKPVFVLVLLCTVLSIGSAGFAQTVSLDSQEQLRLRLKGVEQLVAANRNEEALKELRSMLAADGFDPQGFYNIGNAFARLGDADGAVTSYRKAIAQHNGNYSRALNNLGVVLMRQGRWDEANDALFSALKLESFHYAEASYNLGRLYAFQGQRDLAMREWRRAVRVDPRHTAALQAIASGGRDYEITVAAQPKKITTKGAVDNKEANPRPAAPTPPRASVSAKVLTVDPVTYNDLQQARSAHERGKDQEALTKYRSVISRMGGYFAPANLEMSYILISLKQPSEALPLLQDVTARDGSHFPISYYHLARIYEFSGQLQPAAKAYEQVASYFQGTNPQFLLDVSRVREKQGDFPGALKALEEYINVAENHGAKPQWSDERLASLRQKISQARPPQ